MHKISLLLHDSGNHDTIVGGYLLFNRGRKELFLQTPYNLIKHSKIKHRTIQLLSTAMLLSMETAFAGERTMEVTTPYAEAPFIQDGGNNLAITITGSGILGLTGTSTHRGTTKIGGASGSGLGGNLLVTSTGRIGSNDAAFTIAPTGTLMGGGTVVGAVTNEGILSPSNNRSTPSDGGPALSPNQHMTVTGSFNQTSTGSINLYVTPTTNDRITISTAATFAGGNINIIPLPGYYPSTPTTYTIINWGSHSGTPTVTSTNLDGTPSTKATITAAILGPTGLSISLAGTSETLSTSMGAADVTTAFSTMTNSNSATVPANTTLSNPTVGEHTITMPVIFAGASTISTITGATTIFSQPVANSQSDQIIITGTGITTFSGDNSTTLRGDIAVDQSTVNVVSNLGSGALGLTNHATVSVKDGATLSNAVTAAMDTRIELLPSIGSSVSVNGALSGAGNIYIGDNGTTSGTANFNTPNPSLSGLVTVNSATANIADNSSLGTGSLILAGASPTIMMGNVALPNPISATVASTFRTSAGKTAVLSGPITGSSTSTLTFNGAGKTNLTSTGTSLYEGTLNATSGNLAVNSDMRLADVNVSSGAIVSGTGTMKNLVLASGAIFKPGNSIGTQTITGNHTALTGSISIIEINNAGQSSRGVVSGNIDLQGTHILKILMNTDNGGAYPAGKIDFNILEAGGTLTINQFDVRFVPQTGLSFKIGKLNQPGSAKDHKALVLQYENTGAPIAIATTQVDGDLPGSGISTTPADITITSTDIVSVDSGLLPDTAPVADQVELTNLVFQNHPASDDAVSSAVGDAFRFKGFSSSKTPSVSGKKDAIETLLTALSKNGPASYERNETRLWVSPYANRSRTNRTNSDSGNQGWSGGSLVGVEQRDKKNIWSLGLLTGLMGSRSHVLGTPDTFSKTNGFLIGAFNTYKYTQEWGHEVLISRTNTFVDAQRYGLDRTDKQTPYYALATYKSTTDVGNAQINYLFNIIKKKVTCRLSTGITYLGTQTGKITERNAGANALSSAASTSKSSEIYTGIGLRRIWDVDKITVRTTFVYEYGYELMKKGSGITTTTQSLTQSTAPTTFTTPHGPRQNKHYIQLNSSYLDRNTGLKFILSYSGALYKNVRNHTGMAKVEYRF